MPDNLAHVEELQAIANSLLAEAGVSKDVIPAIPKNVVE